MDITSAIKSIARQGLEIYLRVCTVDEVYEDSRTIDCTPIDEGAPILGVNLQADQSQEVGVVSFPAKGSDVLVGFINPAVAVVLLATEITKSVVTIGNSEITIEDNAVSLVTEKVTANITADSLKLDVDGSKLEMGGGNIKWNEGDFSAVNAEILKEQLDVMTARIDGIINAFGSAGVAPMDGGATFKSNLQLATATLTKEDFSKILDKQIKHGKKQ